jgi:hypothetical protein
VDAPIPRAKCEDGDEGEAAVFAEAAEGKAKIAKEIVEVSFHTGKLYTEVAANCRNLKINEKVATQVAYWWEAAER